MTEGSVKERDSEIIEALATKVMGWRRSSDGWIDARGDLMAYVGSCGSTSCQYDHPQFDPLLDPEASKQVRERLLERFISWSLIKHKHERFEFIVYLPDTDAMGSFYGYADTEERAVALCALSTLAQPAEGE
jgi:hypothetical protein